MPSIQYVFNISVDGASRFGDLFDSRAFNHTYPEAKTIFQLFFSAIGVIAPLKEELLAQISDFQVIGFRRRKSIDKLVFLPRGKLGLAFAVELSVSINCSSKITVLLAFCDKGIAYPFADIIKAFAYKLCDMKLISINTSIGEKFFSQGNIVFVQITGKAFNLVSLSLTEAFKIGSDVPWPVSLDHINQNFSIRIVNACRHMRDSSFDTDAFGTGFHLVNTDMVGKVAFVGKGLSLNLTNDVLRGSARIFDLCNRNTSQKTRDYIVISLNAYMGRAAAYKRLFFIKGLPTYLAAKTHLVKPYKQGLFLIRPVIDSTGPFAVDICNVPASRTSWLSVLFDSVYRNGGIGGMLLYVINSVDACIQPKLMSASSHDRHHQRSQASVAWVHHPGQAVIPDVGVQLLSFLVQPSSLHSLASSSMRYTSRVLTLSSTMLASVCFSSFASLLGFGIVCSDKSFSRFSARRLCASKASHQPGHIGIERDVREVLVYTHPYLPHSSVRRLMVNMSCSVPCPLARRINARCSYISACGISSGRVIGFVITHSPQIALSSKEISDGSVASYVAASKHQPEQPSSSVLVCSTTIRGYRSSIHCPDFAHRVAMLSNMRLHSGLNNEMWCTDKIARSYMRKPTPTGAFPEFSIFFFQLPGNSGCHKGCWGSCSFSSPRLLQVRLAIPYSLSNNTIPTCMVHKDKRDLLSKKFRLVSGRKCDHMKITRNRVAA